MKRSAWLLAVLMISGAGASTHYFGRLAGSAREFQRYYKDLDYRGSPLNPIERVVYSLVLANASVSEPAKSGATLAGRT
jgi:hypothetical protein